MTRINTNVSSLVAQNTLARNSVDLQTALTRLSTGLRINVGKDDPAGLIASEALRSDMTSIRKAVSNSERANQMIATSDSALGQVSSLLNDIRGLVVEAANTGALSEDQIAANQLQVDSSLEAINRIAQTTTFQGRRMLDGSLDFTSTIGSVGTVVDSQIDQANLGASGSVNPEVDINAAATKAAITNSAGFTSSAQAAATLNFAAGTTGTTAASAVIDINATTLSATESGVAINVTDSNDGTGTASATYTSGTSLDISADITGGVTAQDIIDAINNESSGAFAATLASGSGASNFVSADATTFSALTTARDAITITANTPGADYNQIAVAVQSGTANGATYDATQKTITVTINSAAPQTLSSVVTAINTDLSGTFTATASSTGSSRITSSTPDVSATANTDNTGGNVLNDDLVLSIGGGTGREVFNFEAGASINQIKDAINLVSDATGVAAAAASGTLTLNSTDYGSKGIVDVSVISEGSSGTFEGGLSATRSLGTDIQATVNGVNADGDGNTLSINTATLDLNVTFADGDSTNFSFEISGGGALFQLGPDVVSNQQARLGIQSLNTAKLGGTHGKLYELASGGTKALATDPNSAYKVVDEVISKVASLRGRLGAFQRTTLDTNIASLKDTLTNLTEAESSIRDADFAAESSNLTRAQILVQSGTSILAIANSNPKSVLALLR